MLAVVLGLHIENSDYKKAIVRLADDFEKPVMNSLAPSTDSA